MLATNAKTTEPFSAAGGEPAMLASDGTDRVYNQTKNQMLPAVLEQWQYFPVFVKTHPQAGWTFMLLDGFGYDVDHLDNCLHFESLIVLSRPRSCSARSLRFWSNRRASVGSPTCRIACCAHCLPRRSPTSARRSLRRGG